MGIGFVLLIWTLIGLVAAFHGALLLAVVAEAVTRGAANRLKVVGAAAAFPFACLLWAATVFVFQAAVNTIFLHRDIGLGDGFDCPLPNGYALSFIDVLDYGTLYRPGDRPDTVAVNVRFLQLSGAYVLGSGDSQQLEHPEDPAWVNRWFLLDARSGRRQIFASQDALKAAARPLGINLQLVPVGEIYSQYRPTWFDALAGLLLVVPPVAGFGMLVRWTLRVRAARQPGSPGYGIPEA